MEGYTKNQKHGLNPERGNIWLEGIAERQIYIFLICIFLNILKHRLQKNVLKIKSLEMKIWYTLTRWNNVLIYIGKVEKDFW